MMDLLVVTTVVIILILIAYYKIIDDILEDVEKLESDLTKLRKEVYDFVYEVADEADLKVTTSMNWFEGPTRTVSKKTENDKRIDELNKEIERIKTKENDK